MLQIFNRRKKTLLTILTAMVFAFGAVSVHAQGERFFGVIFQTEDGYVGTLSCNSSAGDTLWISNSRTGELAWVDATVQCGILGF